VSTLMLAILGKNTVLWSTVTERGSSGWITVGPRHRHIFIIPQHSVGMLPVFVWRYFNRATLLWLTEVACEMMANTLLYLHHGGSGEEINLLCSTSAARLGQSF